MSAMERELRVTPRDLHKSVARSAVPTLPICSSPSQIRFRYFLVQAADHCFEVNNILVRGGRTDLATCARWTLDFSVGEASQRRPFCSGARKIFASAILRRCYSKR